MKLTETRDGNNTFQIRGVNIHSAYSPVKEAEKFFNKNVPPCTTLIILGAGLGYLYSCAEKALPECRILAIPYSPETGEYTKKEFKNIEIWDGKSSLFTFFMEKLTEWDLKGLQVIEWPPMARALPKMSELANKSVIDSVRRLNGNLMTTAAFGKKWIKNSVHNYIHTESYIKDFSINKPVIITSSGPTLEKSLPYIEEFRERVMVLALSSSLAALNHWNILPDLCVSTDPGYYSQLHLEALPQGVPLLSPLSNCRKKRTKNPILLINQNNFTDRSFIETLNLPSITLGENGTVAGTALDFSLQSSKGSVILAGQDLCSRGIQSHVSPHTFEPLLKKEVQKTSPYEGILFSRYINSGSSLKTYEAWFHQRGTAYSDRIYRLTGSKVKLRGITDVKGDFLSTLPGQTGPGLNYTRIDAPSFRERTSNLMDILDWWLRELKNGNSFKREIISLIATPKMTEINNRTLPEDKREALFSEAKEESICFLERLKRGYGTKLF